MTSGAVVLNGMLSIAVVSPYTPLAGHAFNFLSANSVSGRFTTTLLPPLFSSIASRLTFSPTGVTLRFFGPRIAIAVP